VTTSQRRSGAGRGRHLDRLLASLRPQAPAGRARTGGWDVPKASPASVAARIFDGLDRGEDEIFPDDVSAKIAEEWRGSAFKALEVEWAAMVAGGA